MTQARPVVKSFCRIQPAPLLRGKMVWKTGGPSSIVWPGWRPVRGAAEVHGVMRFILIDKIIALEPGRSIRTVKSVSMAEEYLGDHFPTFPVLPGVLLLQGLVESASWLVRTTEDFAHSMILLEQARNVKYRSFLSPGGRIEYRVTARDIEENLSSFIGEGTADGQPILEARFALRHFNLSDRNRGLAAVDAEVVRALRDRWKSLYAGIQTQQETDHGHPSR